MKIDRNTRLTEQQETLLSAAIQQGDDKALAQLVEANLNFVAHIAKRFTGQGVEFDDLVSEGYLAMVKAAPRFHGGQGIRFVNYVAPILQQTMQQAIQQQAGLYQVPKHERSDAEMRRSRGISVDAPIPAGSQNNFNLLHVVENKDAPQADQKLLSDDNDDALGTLIRQLNQREQQVMRLVYGIQQERHTMAETAKIMGLKRERVRQIRNQCLRKLKKNKAWLMQLS